MSFIDLEASTQPQSADEYLKVDKSMEQYFNALRSLKIKNAQIILDANPEWNTSGLGNDLLSVYTGNLLEITDNDTLALDISKIFRNLINGYIYQNNKEGYALETYQSFSTAIELSNKIDFLPALKFSLISMLNLLNKEVFLGTDKFTPYLNHYKEIKSDKTDELLISLFEIGLKTKENADFNSIARSREVIKEFDELFSNISDDNPLKVNYIYRKGIQAKVKQNYNEALPYLRKTIKLTANSKIHKDLHGTAIWQMSSVFMLTKKYDSSLYYLDKSRKLNEDLRSVFFDDLLASWIYNGINQPDSAYHYLRKARTLEYKLDAKKNSLESSLLSVENQTEKLKLDKLRLDNRRKTNQNYFIAALSMFVIGLITAVFLQKNTRKKRQLAEQTALLEQQKVETLLKEQELLSIDAMIAGQEKERSKVANELHDDLGSLMATVKLHFDNVKVDEKDPAMKNAQALLEKAYQKIRGMAHAKNSGVMANQGLLPAIQKMARTINETNALEVTVEDFGLADRMENSLELTIFRILQELITNIIKHAQATKASIQFTQHDDKLNIIVEDDGKGFDMSLAKRKESGMGLTTIEKRIEHLEGSFTVDSVLGKGTSILIDIPV